MSPNPEPTSHPRVTELFTAFDREIDDDSQEAGRGIKIIDENLREVCHAVALSVARLYHEDPAIDTAELLDALAQEHGLEFRNGILGNATKSAVLGTPQILQSGSPGLVVFTHVPGGSRLPFHRHCRPSEETGGWGELMVTLHGEVDHVGDDSDIVSNGVGDDVKVFPPNSLHLSLRQPRGKACDVMYIQPRPYKTLTKPLVDDFANVLGVMEKALAQSED